MTPTIDLEDFDTAPGEPLEQSVDIGAEPSDAAALEATRVAGYEDGYKTGWDDAVKAADEDARNVSAELSRNLRDLGFSYFEARDDLLATIEPFISELLEALFPELLSESAAAQIVGDLSDRIRERHDGRVRILVAPEDGEVVRRLVGMASGLDVEIAEEPALAAGQAQVRSERRDVAIDPGQLLARLRTALEASADKPAEIQALG